MWLKKKTKRSTPIVTDEDVMKLQEEATVMAVKAGELEKAVMDGENDWFLVPCPKPAEPVCVNPFEEPEHVL